MILADRFLPFVQWPGIVVEESRSRNRGTDTAFLDEWEDIACCLDAGPDPEGGEFDMPSHRCLS
jgi:hypothetical protein